MFHSSNNNFTSEWSVNNLQFKVIPTIMLVNVSGFLLAFGGRGSLPLGRGFFFVIERRRGEASAEG